MRSKNAQKQLARTSLKHTSGHLNSKSLLCVLLMMQATQKEQATMILNINKSSRMICNRISQQLQFVDFRKMGSVNPVRNILTCASQNLDEEMLVALKSFN